MNSFPKAAVAGMGRRDFFRLTAAALGAASLPAWTRIVGADAEPSLRTRLVQVDAPVAAATADSGAFRLRVIKASTALPMRLDAVYPHASHRFWYAWQERGEMHESLPAPVRWEVRQGGLLPMTLTQAGTSVPLAVPAAEGTYLLAVAADGAAPPDLRRFELSGDDCGSRSVVCRTSGTKADFPHLLLAVEAVTV